jgi:hypothetical protein
LFRLLLFIVGVVTVLLPSASAAAIPSSILPISPSFVFESSSAEEFILGLTHTILLYSLFLCSTNGGGAGEVLLLLLLLLFFLRKGEGEGGVELAGRGGVEGEEGGGGEEKKKKKKKGKEDSSSQPLLGHAFFDVRVLDSSSINEQYKIFMFRISLYFLLFSLISFFL